MSVFVKSLKTFESDVTGEVKEYKINNAVWLHMKSKFDLTQTEWAKQYAEEEMMNGVRFIVCVLKANGIDVTETEVLENTDGLDVINFTIAYQTAMNGSKETDADDQEEEPEGK